METPKTAKAPKMPRNTKSIPEVVRALRAEGQRADLTNYGRRAYSMRMHVSRLESLGPDTPRDDRVIIVRAARRALRLATA